MKKYSYLIASLFSLTTAFLVADQPQNGKQQGQQGQQAQQQQSDQFTKEPQGVITPAVAPRVDNGADFFITADFIWWKAHLGGMNYGVTGVADGGTFVPVNTSTSRGKDHQPSYDFRPGFKIGAGLDFAHDGWDFFANYTWLKGVHQHDSLSASPGRGAKSMPLIDNDGNVSPILLSNASARWHQLFNVLDLELGRNFYISKRLSLRPSFGLKSAWIGEKFNASFTEAGTNEHWAAKFRQHMWGIGIRAGLDSVWHFTKNWGIYGDVYATALWSDFHAKARYKSTPAVGVVTTNLNTRDVHLDVIPVLEASLGLTYMTWFSDDSYQLLFQAGWEEQVWLDFNHLSNQSQNNLSFQGLTIKALFAF